MPSSLSANFKPRDSQFHQQQLPAWHPVVSVSSVLPLLCFITVLFLCIGIGLLLTSADVNEVVVTYTDCKNEKNEFCAEIPYDVACICNVSFRIDRHLPSPVTAYYGLSGFYQNYRTYALSRDDFQLHGKVQSELSSNCDPYRYYTNSTTNATLFYAPCGLVANSIFNDTFRLLYHPTLAPSTMSEVFMQQKGIAWQSDVNAKFGTPPSDSWQHTVRPPDWRRSAYERDPAAYSGDEPLIVWMRISALPTFRKPYAKVVHAGLFTKNLTVGQYTLVVNYAFPVLSFQGTKRFILSSSNVLGGKNVTLGMMFSIVGVIYLIVTMIFFGLHVHCRRSKMTCASSDVSAIT